MNAKDINNNFSIGGAKAVNVSLGNAVKGSNGKTLQVPESAGSAAKEIKLPVSAKTQADNDLGVVVSLSDAAKSAAMYEGADSNEPSKGTGPSAASEANASDPASNGAASKVTQTNKTLEEAIEEMRARSAAMREQIENARQQGDAIAKTFEIKRKCMIIAMRIMGGDNVPDADYRFLMENEPDMYKQAIMLRRQKENPDEYDRLSEDEEESSKASADAVDSDAANVTATQPPATSGGETSTEGEMVSGSA